MNGIKHHLNDQLLMAYAAGSVPEAFGLVIASHVSLCDDCRARLGAFESLGGAVLEEALADAGECSVDEGALTAILERKAEAPVARTGRRAVTSAVFPAPLRDYVGGDLDAVRWRGVGGGVAQAVLKTADGATARLIRIPAGAAVPDHGHRGMELTLVLKGAFADDTARFGRGDVEIAGEEMHHTPVAEPGEECICLAATDAPLRFKGILPRLAQPFLGI